MTSPDGPKQIETKIYVASPRASSAPFAEFTSGESLSPQNVALKEGINMISVSTAKGKSKVSLRAVVDDVEWDVRKDIEIEPGRSVTAEIPVANPTNARIGLITDQTNEKIEYGFRVVNFPPAETYVPPAEEFNGIVTVGHVSGGSAAGTDFTVSIPGARPGDKIAVAVNAKAVSQQKFSSIPSGFSLNMDSFWVGSQKCFLATGDYLDNMKFSFTSEAEFVWSAVAIRGAERLVVGAAKGRNRAPYDAGNQITAPAVEAVGDDLAFAFAYERTTGGELESQISVSPGWRVLRWQGEIEFQKYQTLLLAQANTPGQSSDLRVTYPNSQEENAVAIQVIAKAPPTLETVATPVNALLSTQPFMVAHRLGGADYPEHTLRGLQVAVTKGFKAFEFSTYRTRDGVFVGTHDWTTERLIPAGSPVYAFHDTDWATIATLQQPAGPFIRIQDLVQAMPRDGVIFLDHKATSAVARAGDEDMASEEELFDLLDTLFEKPQDHVIWKVFADASSAERARARGYKVNCMLYAADLPTANFARWDVLGYPWNGQQANWDMVKATGKPTIGHIIDGKEPNQASVAMSKGINGLMVSIINTVNPAKGV